MQRRSAHAGDACDGAPGGRWFAALLACTCALILVPAQSAFAVTVSPSTIDAVAGTPFNGPVATFTDTSLGLICPGPSMYSASVAWADQTTSLGTVVAGTQRDLTTCPYQVTAAHTFPAPGTEAFRVSVNATAADGTAHVAPGPAITATPFPIDTAEARSFSATLATFTDADPSLTKDDFQATIDWGDGTSSPGLITVDTPHSFGVFAQHAYADPGAYTATVTIAQGLANSTTVGVGVTINDAALGAAGASISATEGVPFSGVVAGFTDADTSRAPGYYTSSVNWGDGATTAASLTANPAGGFFVHAAHAYTDPGNYTASVTIADPRGQLTSVATAVGVADAGLAATGTSISATEGVPFSGVVADFGDADNGRAPGYYTSSVNWGDGSASPATLTTNPGGGFFVHAGHAYNDPGNYTATVTIAEPSGQRISTATAVGVAGAVLSATGLHVTATEGAAFSAVLATFRDADLGRPAGHDSASVNWGDGTPATAGAIAGDGSGGFTVADGHAYVHAGSYAVTVTIADPGGQTTAGGSAGVADAPLTSAAAKLSAVAGTKLQARIGNFSDPDPNATPANFAVTVDWGDGSATTGAGVSGDPAGGFAVDAGHTYGVPGTFPTTIAISDSGGSATSATGSVVVTAPPPPPPAVTTPTPTPTPTPKITLPELPPVVGVGAPRLAGRSTFTLRVTCPSAAPHCRGVARVVTLAPRSRKSALRGGTTLGSQVFVLGSGETRSVTITVPTKLRATLRKARSARLAGVAIAYGANGHSRATTGAPAVVSTTRVR